MTKPEIPFEPWPKIPRLMKDVIITEKIDGTNAGIYVEEVSPEVGDTYALEGTLFVEIPGGRLFVIYASSRKRWITPENDNYGFARWVDENAATLATDLGPGMHFGEWWGAGIQRRYDQEHKRFSLFNVRKWLVDAPFTTPGMGVVPVLYEGPFSGDYTTAGMFANPWTWALEELKTFGSIAAPGFMDPEGIIVYHTAAGHGFKVILRGEGDKVSG